MKKLITLLLVSMLVLNIHAQDKKKIALLQPRAVVSTTAVDPMEVSVVRGELRNALTNQSNFQVLTRLDVDKIFEEHEFQKSGLVDDTQRKRVGVMTGAQYICVSSITKFRNQIYIEAYMIDIETGEMTNTASQYAKIENYDYSTLPSVCQNLTSQMLGEIGSSNSRPQPNKSNYSSGSSSKPTVSTPANQNFTETVKGVSFTMVYVEGGTFTMGCTSEQGSDCDSDEKPAHSVTLSGYYIAETEVTQGLWQAVMGDNPTDFKQGDDYPVEMVSWQDAMEFCSRLSELTGRTYTLPTEAQWEYAARGGNKSSGYIYAGSDYIDNVGWVDNDDGYTTHSVKSKLSNELGLYDMSGNVWEWCKDWYGPYLSNSQTNPAGPSSGSYRVLRGGSWGNNAHSCRVAVRDNSVPTNFGSVIGFRVVLFPVATLLGNSTSNNTTPKNPTPRTTNPTTPSNQNFTETVNGVSFTMVYVEGGTFTMGCTSEQGSDCDSDDKPAHSVTLSAYYIGETEVTQGLWRAVMGDNPSDFKKGDDYPVENVSWHNAMAFCSRLSELTGRTYTLPTEAQWEYAARGGNKSRGYKYAGSDYLESVGWNWDNSGSTTHPVKRKSPNSLGLYDMSGNVYEWCKDWYGEYSSSSQTNPTGASSGSSRVLRGGSWSDYAQRCRVANRRGFSPSFRFSYDGFRIVLLR